MPSSARVRSTASTIFFLPSLDRWDRPTAASIRTSGVHPGRLAQGPDEKSGRAGRMFGFIKPLPYRRAALRWGSVARGRYTDVAVRRQRPAMSRSLPFSLQALPARINAPDSHFDAVGASTGLAQIAQLAH